MEKTANIPPLAFQDYSIDVQIRIYQTGARYGADIFAMGQMRRIPIEMSAHDLADLNKQLQEAIKNTAHWAAHHIGETTKDLQEQLYPLAELGNYVYRKIFSYHDTMNIMQSLLAMSSKATIEIASEDFFVPWELLYPVSLNKPVSYRHFWGMNYIISRVIIQNDYSVAFIPPTIPFSSRPKLGLLTNSSLSAVVDTEVPFFEKLHNDGKIHLFRLRNLDAHPKKKQTELKEFKSFLCNTLDLAHFACHASYETQQPNKSYIVVSNEFPITIMDLEIYQVSINNHPLIIMNACETGNLNPLYTAHFAAAFLKLGVRGVVTTECAVSDTFAANFAKKLYTELLAGEPLGSSLLATRQYFLHISQDPSGLLYSMYAPPSVRLVQVEA